MQYMLLIYDEPAKAPEPGSDGWNAEMPKWGEYTTALREAGVLLGGGALQSTGAATTVRGSNGDRVVTDGPFAETKEALGGYYAIDVPDLDAAIEWAAKMPNIARGSVEVRPIVPTGADAPAR